MLTTCNELYEMTGMSLSRFNLRSMKMKLESLVQNHCDCVLQLLWNSFTNTAVMFYCTNLSSTLPFKLVPLESTVNIYDMNTCACNKSIHRS